jgi:hypothetical protein
MLKSDNLSGTVMFVVDLLSGEIKRKDFLNPYLFLKESGKKYPWTSLQTFLQSRIIGVQSY